MNKQDKKKLTKHIELNQHMTEISMFGRTAVVDVVPSDRLLDLIDELVSPVKVPQFVAEWFEKNKDDLEFNIWKYIRNWNEHPKDGFQMFMNNGPSKPIETLIRMKDGYEVEEEPEWVVKRGLFYFEEFDSQMNGDKFGFNGDQRLAKAHHFSDKSKAEAVADLIGGEVKKTENDVSESGPF